MPRSEQWKEQNYQSRKRNATTITIQLRNEDKANWDAYAQSRGKPLATLIRELMAADMEKNGWNQGNQD